VSVYQLNPLEDHRWQEFVDRHPESSIFHTTGWLEALCRSYGYQPIVYTTTPPGRDLANGLVFCRVQSWLSGCRLVSLPFSDHCQPLIDGPESAAELLAWLERSQRRQEWKYIELRPAFAGNSPFEADGMLLQTESYFLHTLDLRPHPDSLFQCFDKSCIQRKIRRAEREQLIYEEGFSEKLLAKFYFLLILTRRRHGVPPQPLAWFRNAIAGLKNNILIRVASKGNQPVASILTILYKNTLTYKYGCSDARFNNLGGTPFLFWKAIQDAKSKGATKYDLGRSEVENAGLISFKENWGATGALLNYLRVPGAQSVHPHSDWATRLAKNVFSKMPDVLLTATGRLLYRHIG
jgi:hypothetical protein